MSATITAADVNKLRQTTGAGMMDCRKALVESEGDFEKAIDYLRKKGQKVAANRSDREAKEGVVIAKANPDGNYGIVLQLSSETDFVAKNAEFIDFANELAALAEQNMPTDIDALKALPMAGATVGDKLLEMVAKIGEKIDVVRYEQVSADAVIAYIHGNYRIGVLVGLNQANQNDVQLNAGRDVAMQIAAMNPLGLNHESIEPAVIERERGIVMDQMKTDPKMAGKPDDMIAKVAEGKLNAFFKENTLMAQAFVKDNGKSVADYLKGIHQDLTVTQFVRVAVG
ncbi:MAG: elongation factor Ts [Sphingobacteriales bacterium]|nr:MAG: elongation factor Ts [Sphingobacteriales bacterium]